jgi:hypothetical protein
VPPKCGKLTERLRSLEYIKISHPDLVKELKARREPSGEMRGESEMEAW